MSNRTRFLLIVASAFCLGLVLMIFTTYETPGSLVSHVPGLSQGLFWIHTPAICLAGFLGSLHVPPIRGIEAFSLIPWTIIVQWTVIGALFAIIDFLRRRRRVNPPGA